MTGELAGREHGLADGRLRLPLLDGGAARPQRRLWPRRRRRRQRRQQHGAGGAYDRVERRLVAHRGAAAATSAAATSVAVAAAGDACVVGVDDFGRGGGTEHCLVRVTKGERSELGRSWQLAVAVSGAAAALLV